MKYWPGSGTLKSTSNAFNWKSASSQIMKDSDMKRIQREKQQKVHMEPRHLGLMLTKEGKNNG